MWLIYPIKSVGAAWEEMVLVMVRMVSQVTILYSIQYAAHQLAPAETRNNLGCNEVSLTSLITQPANTVGWEDL